MITEDYCSYEVSKLLNEKGLNGMCDTVIGRDGTKYDIKLYDYVEEETTSCPTHQMAMKWLREVHKLFLDISFQKDEDGSVTWFYMTWALDDRKRDAEEVDFASYEEAVEAALKYVLENLI